MAKMVSRNKLRVTKRVADDLLMELRQYMDHNGYLSWSEKEKKYVLMGTLHPRRGLVRCPQCKVGQLMIVRSQSTGKRFIGCSNFSNGCMSSSPLLQRARLRGTKRPCTECGWPIVMFRYSNKQKWSKMCSNVECPTRK